MTWQHKLSKMVYNGARPKNRPQRKVEISINALKKYIILITYSLGLFFVFKNFDIIWTFLCKFSLLLTPFIYGFVLAYIINWPYKFIKFRLKKFNLFYNNDNLCKITSLLLAYILFISIFCFTIVILVPQLIVSFQTLSNNASHYLNLFETTYKSLLSKFNFGNWNLSDVIEKFLANKSSVIPQGIFTKAFDFVKNFAIIIYNWTIGIIASIYFLFNKEKLLKQVKKLIFVLLPNKYYEFFKYVVNLSHEYFGKFIIGKVIDSLIIGILCFLGTTILDIPYSLLVSTVVGITNIIPFFGPFLGAIPCILILLVISPVKSITFAIFVLILQQIDGNIIGPRILGNTIGISGMFIMFSVIIGGGLFGIAGMILGVPVFAVIYTVLSKVVNTKLKNKSQNTPI